MKTSEIVVGQLYGHSNHDDTVYLGSQDDRIKPRKGLTIVVAGPHSAVGTGCPVHSRQVLHKRYGNDKFWDGFYPIAGRLVLEKA